MNKSAKTKAIVAGAALCLAGAVLAAGTRTETSTPGGTPRSPIVQTQPQAAPRIEIVFAIDTTGSMGGLIEGAKAKIWSVASTMAQGQPQPEIRIGLVAYRDRGDAYVTQTHDLTGDLDLVYERLMGFRAEGGGDTPEHVNAALADAIRKTSWSPSSVKMIFVVGDAPPHMDYGDGLDHRSLAREARSRGISLHTIRCGGDPQTGEVWEELAALGGGAYTTVEQSGGVFAAATPVDERLAELNRRLTSTAVVVGDGEAHARMARKGSLAAAAPAPSAADRAAFYARSGAKMDDADVLEELASGRLDVAAIDDDKLPAEMRGMSVDERRQHVALKQRERAEVRKEIARLAAERDAYLKSERKKSKRAAGFDDVVEGAARKEAAAAGVAF